jgi:hypothetical protein
VAISPKANNKPPVNAGIRAVTDRFGDVAVSAGVVRDDNASRELLPRSVAESPAKPITPKPMSKSPKMIVRRDIINSTFKGLLK